MFRKHGSGASSHLFDSKFFNAVRGKGHARRAICDRDIGTAKSPDPEQNSSLNDPDIAELRPHRAAVIDKFMIDAE
jgi:hypothetical protein